MTAPEVSTIRKYLNNPAFTSWTSASIYHRILADRAAFLSISTFYLYVHRLGLSRRFRTFRSRKEGIRGSRPAEILHADITELRLRDHRKVYIYHVIDNFSRFVFTCRAEFIRSASISLNNLESILRDFPLFFEQKASLLVDDGVENRGHLREFTSRNRELVRLLIAQKDILFSNSMVESANRTLKNQYIKDRGFASLESLQAFLDDYREDFNGRNLHALAGLTPCRVFNGEMPDKSHRMDQMAEARQLRIMQNRTFDCKSCSSEQVAD